MDEYSVKMIFLKVKINMLIIYMYINNMYVCEIFLN